MSPWVHLEAVLYFLAFLLASTAWKVVRSPRTRVMLRRVRALTLAHAAVVLLGVLVTGAWLREAVPLLSWSWLAWLGAADASLVTGQGLAPDAPHSPGPILVIAPYLFPLLLLLAMPRLVWAEERWFRRGAERFTPLKRVAWPAAFGLAHLVMGVPLFAAVALMLAGAIFQRAYMRGYVDSGGSRLAAVQASTALHVTYNTLILALVALAFALRATAAAS